MKKERKYKTKEKSLRKKRCERRVFLLTRSFRKKKNSNFF